METTLNLRPDISKKIFFAAQRKGISRSEIIIILVKKIMDNISKQGCAGRMVQYQKRRSQKDWHRFHLHVREDEYEYILDLKKLLKMSVSLMVTYAVDKFLNTLLNSDYTDNNRYRNYIIIREIIDNIVCWRFFWGLPPNIERLFNQLHIE